MRLSEARSTAGSMDRLSPSEAWVGWQAGLQIHQGTLGLRVSRREFVPEITFLLVVQAQGVA